MILNDGRSIGAVWCGGDGATKPFSSERFFWWRVSVDHKEEHYGPMHCVMDMTLLCMCYVKCELVTASGSGCKRQSKTWAQQQEEAPLSNAWHCLVLPFAAELKSCFARLRQSPELDVKNIR